MSNEIPGEVEKLSAVNENKLVTKELATVEVSRADEIKAVFEPMYEMLKGFEAEYARIMSLEKTPANCEIAKALRLKIVKIRTTADKERKVLKEQYLRGGNAIQGVYNILKFAVMDKEDDLKDFEEHFINLEKQRISDLIITRTAELEQYEATAEGVDLGAMTDDVYKNYLSGVKLNFEKVQAEELRIKEEEEEAERQAEIDRQNLIKENEALKETVKKQAINIQQGVPSSTYIREDGDETIIKYLLKELKQAHTDASKESSKTAIEMAMDFLEGEL